MGDGELPKQALPVCRPMKSACWPPRSTPAGAHSARRRQAAEHAANQLLRKIVSQIPGVVFQYRLFADGHGCFPFASEAFYDIYGIRPEAVSQCADAIRELVHPDDRDSFFDALQHSARTLTQWRTEYRICLPDGQIKWLLVDAMPEQDDHDVLWYGFIADISRHKRMEAELRIAATTFLTQEGIMVTDPRASSCGSTPPSARLPATTARTWWARPRPYSVHTATRRLLPATVAVPAGQGRVAG
jgi:PAS domain S-box-containing protein